MHRIFIKNKMIWGYSKLINRLYCIIMTDFDIIPNGFLHNVFLRFLVEKQLLNV